MTALPQTTTPALQLATPAPLPEPPAAGADEILVRTRFGVVAAHPDAVIEMPQGPLGFTQHRRFVLTDLPNPKLAQFKLLQSTTAPEVSFVVTPYNPESNLIATADIEQGCMETGMTTAGDVLVLLILTVRQEAGGVAMSVNLRAPIVLDPVRRIARQIVLANASYAVRHPL